ncbi:MAG TPA: hypothetical protein VGO62_11580, partial [Myxococcota bacterium]
MLVSRASLPLCCVFLTLSSCTCGPAARSCSNTSDCLAQEKCVPVAGQAEGTCEQLTGEGEGEGGAGEG